MIVFPCTVTMHDGTVRSVCKIHATDDGVDVWWWDSSQGRPVIVAHATANETVVGDPITNVAVGATVEADTTAGRISIRRESSCGCGHPLKRWAPPGARRSASTARR